MQPILILGLVAAVAITMGSGFLLTPTIDVWLQRAGFGTAVAMDPVDHVSVDIDIDKVRNNGPDQTPNTNDDFWDNVITECSFHIAGGSNIHDQDMDPQTNDGVEEVICKLTENNVVKGEVSKTFINGGRIDCTPEGIALGTFCPSEHYVLKPINWADGSAAKITEWTDVLIVVRGQNPTIVP